MAHIDALIDKIADSRLQQAIREQIEVMLTKQSFGLVYQPHKPETVELPNYTLRPNCMVRRRDENDEQLYSVQSLKAGTATITTLTEDPQVVEVAVTDLVVVREFGDSVYPGLNPVDSISRGADKPWHVVINAENFHALQTLLYTHTGAVDAIYIDPPYNSGARDWKYNNDYVDGVDQYRHSKWLAFMERRLELAEKLLNPERSVLVVTIDENEVHHLGMLLERMFPDAALQMVTAVINGSGQARNRGLTRVEEYLFFVFVGDAGAAQNTDDLLGDVDRQAKGGQIWRSLLRAGAGRERTDREGLFYPIFVDPSTGSIVSVGEPPGVGVARSTVAAPKGQTAVWPLMESGDEGRWQVSPSSLRSMIERGFARVGRYDRRNERWAINYLRAAEIKRLERGELVSVGRDQHGAHIIERAGNVAAPKAVKTVWHRDSHDAGTHGSGIVRRLLPGRSFPFPKSLYAVEDALRIMVGDKRDALVLDFFAGSGTTAHAVARLNAEDGGERRSITITNNEVSIDEAKALRAKGLRPGDEEWEALGICRYITWPRLKAAVGGLTSAGEPARGEYRDEMQLDLGFDENFEFFDLTYEDPDQIGLGRKFQTIAPLLWLKAGARGARIEIPEPEWSLPAEATYGVLFSVDYWRGFVEAVAKRTDVGHAYIVTDSIAAFQQIRGELTGIECTQLYADYLRTFEINTRGRS